MAADQYELLGSVTPGVALRPLSPRSKRPRVSFATVTQRTFASDCEDPTNLSSPQERQLSPPLEPSIISDRSGADQQDGAYNEEDSTSELRFPGMAASPPLATGEPQRGPTSPESSFEASVDGQTTGDVTANVIGLQNLLLQDQSDAANAWASSGRETSNSLHSTAPRVLNSKLADFQTGCETTQTKACDGNGLQTASAASGDDRWTAHVHGTECTSPVPTMEASPEHDLYAQFKRTATMLDTPATAAESLSEAEVEDEENETQQGRDACPREHTEHTIDIAHLIATSHRDETADEGMDPNDSLVLEARPLFCVVEGMDFEGLNREFDSKRAHDTPEAPDTPCKESRCGVGGGMEAPGDLQQASRAAGLLAQQQHDSAASTALEQGVALESDLQHSFISNESTLLPAASSLLSIPNSNLEFGSSLHHRHMSWDDFLSQCEIDFGSRAHARCGRGADTTAKPKHKDYFHLVTTETLPMTSERQCQLQTLVRCWNHAGKNPPSLVELLHSTEVGRRAEFLERMHRWEHACKIQAKLQWSQAQNRWLRETLSAQRSATADLQHRSNLRRENTKQLEQLCKYMHSRLQLLQHKPDVQHRRVWASSQEIDKQTLEHKAFMCRQASRAQEASDLAREKLKQLEGLVEQARKALGAAQQKTNSLKRSYLIERALRVALQRQQCARTCYAHHRTSTGVCFSLRGGATASIEPLVSSKPGISEDQVCMRLCPPPRESDLSLKYVSSSLVREQELARTLLMHTWHGILAVLPKASVPHPGKAALLEAVLPRAEIPCLISQLDASVLSISEQVELLSSLHREFSGVTRIEPWLHNAGTLVLVVTLVSVRSHTVSVKGISPLHHGHGTNQRDVSKLTLQFTWHLAGFPVRDHIDWSSTRVRQVFGREGDALAVERALQRVRGQGSIRGRGGCVKQALAAALGALGQDHTVSGN